MHIRTTAVAAVLFAGLSVSMAGTAMAADVYNCADFDWQDEAQAEFDKDMTDPNQLDDDNDSEACETLPRRAVAAPAAAAAAATSGTTTASQVSTVPSGAIAAGDGSSSGEAGVLPYAVGGVALIGAAGAAAAARRARSAA
jgi:hypothetical protein